MKASRSAEFVAELARSESPIFQFRNGDAGLSIKFSKIVSIFVYIDITIPNVTIQTRYIEQRQIDIREMSVS